MAMFAHIILASASTASSKRKEKKKNKKKQFKGIKKGRWTVKKQWSNKTTMGKSCVKFWQKKCRPKIAQDKYCVNNPLNFRGFILKNNPWLAFCQNGTGKNLG